MRRENEEGESVGRFLTKTAGYIQARLGDKWQYSCKFFQTWCPQYGVQIHHLAPLWKCREPWLLSSGCAGMQHVDTAGSVLETSAALHIPLPLSNTDVFCLEVGADGMNSFISTAQTQNKN